MLSLKQVTKTFTLDEHTTITPVDQVNLDIARGELIMIVGRSGSGKSTLLNLAAGLVRPSAGQIMLDDHDLAKLSDRELSNVRAERMGFIFQFPSLLQSLRVVDNVSLPGVFTRSGGSKSDSKVAIELLEKVGLASKADVFPLQLSAGEQKRAVIARALFNSPQLVLADEPTSDLDEETEAQIMEMLRKINSEGVTFIIVTHSLELLPYASRAFEMINGTLKELETRKASFSGLRNGAAP
ncbi:ABC transporter ATP-binding protein [Dehalogenimonas sp. THU2]|uniref:ABC transporter ATP-binding protein n=1 Tax=Dehalogenimonas sp. THU2 TaxID=3151121 RepID=UPI0032186651